MSKPPIKRKEGATLITRTNVTAYKEYNWAHVIFFIFFLKHSISEGGNDGGTIPNVLHEIRRNSQWLKAINCSANIMLER